MQIQTEGKFERTPVLENCAFFTCVQCGHCGYLILGGSAKELRDEEEQHAIECKATHGLIGAGNLGGPRTEASSSPGGSHSEVDCGFIYRDCEVVMNARNIARLAFLT